MSNVDFARAYSLNMEIREDRFDPTMLQLARHVSTEGNCARRYVGAVIVRNGEVISTGANGVAPEFSNCIEAGCPRCVSGGSLGIGYDLCICIHAEQKAVTNAARDGISVEGGTMYVNLRPCLNCLVVAHNAGIKRLFYEEGWSYPPDIEKVYQGLSSAFEVFGQRSECVPGAPPPRV